MDLAAVAGGNYATGEGRKVRKDEVPCALLGCGKQGTSFIIQHVKVRNREIEITHTRCEGHLDRLPNLLPWWELLREEIESVPVQSGIRCGACRGKHSSVQEVKACHKHRSSATIKTR